MDGFSEVTGDWEFFLSLCWFALDVTTANVAGILRRLAGKLLFQAWGNYWVLSTIAVGNGRVIRVRINCNALWFRRGYGWDCNDFSCGRSRQLRWNENVRGAVPRLGFFTQWLFNVEDVIAKRVEWMNFDQFWRSGIIKEDYFFNRMTWKSYRGSMGIVKKLPSGGVIFEILAVMEKIDEVKWLSLWSEFDNK